MPDFLIKYRMHSVKSFTLATIEITEYDYITEESIPPFYNKTSTSNKIIQRELDEKTAEIIKQILIPPKPIDIRIKKYLIKETSKIDFELYEELQVKPSSKRFLEGNNIILFLHAISRKIQNGLFVQRTFRSASTSSCKFSFHCCLLSR